MSRPTCCRPQAKLPVLLLALVAGGLACEARAPAPEPLSPALAAPGPAALPPAPAAGVLATVGQVPITEQDVRLALRLEDDKPLEPDLRARVLETLIRQELAAQKATVLALDRDPRYAEALGRQQAQVRAFVRKELADALFRQEVQHKSAVSEAEARAHFEANARQIRTETHVLQILSRSEEEIRGLAEELKQGKKFEEVAGKTFTILPPDGQKPWDLGWLRWAQLPPAWREVVPGLAEGATSDVLTGPGGRYWLVHVVARRENPLKFEDVRDALIEELKAAKVQTLQAKLDQELQTSAPVVRKTADK